MQYCLYRAAFKSKFAISVTENGSPYDHAVAERVKGILKDEFGLDEMTEDFINQINRLNKPQTFTGRIQTIAT